MYPHTSTYAWEQSVGKSLNTNVMKAGLLLLVIVKF